MRESLSMSNIEPPPPLSPPPLDNTADHEQPPEICMNDSVVVDKVDKDEKELCCMETSSSPPVAETFDIIESNDVDAATNEVLAPDAEMPIDVSLAENLNVVDKIDQDQVVASPPSPKATKDEPSCPVIAPANEEDEEDCSCTTTGSRSPTPVHFEITPKGVKVISDKESFL